MTVHPATTSVGHGGKNTVFPVIPSTIELYDLLMQEIEPELVSMSVPLLPAKYRGETKEDADIRAARYAKAFQEYDRRLEQYIGELNASIRKLGRDTAAAMEALERSMSDMSSLDTPENSTATS